MIKRPIDRYGAVILICILGAIPPLVWFRHGLIIAGGDNFFYLNPGANFFKYSHAWLSNIAAGVPNQSVPQIFPLMFFWTVLENLGISLVNIERLWAMLLFTLPGLSMYYLISNIDTGTKNRKLAGFIAAILYMFNMFVTIDVLQPNLRPVQAALPVALCFWIKGLNARSFSLKFPVLIGVTSLFYASSNINLPTISVIPIILGLYLLFFLVTNPTKRRHASRFTCSTVIIYLMVNSWWLLATVPAMQQASVGIKEAVKSSDFIISTHLNEAFRFMGFWAYRTTYEGVPIIPYSAAYYEPLLLISTYSLVMLVFSFLLFDIESEHVHFFSLLALTGLFLVKGANAPLGPIFAFFYENVPGFWIYREPFAKFTTINTLAFSVLLGVSVERIYDKAGKWQVERKGKLATLAPGIIPVLVVMLVLACSFPLLSGEVIWNNNAGSMRSLYVKVPEYWHELGDWLKRDGNARVLLIPRAAYGHAHRWESGIGTAGSIAQVLLPNPVIDSSYTPLPHSNALINELYNDIGPEKNLDISPLLSLLDVKYVLQQNDLAWEHGLLFKSDSPADIKRFLLTQPNLLLKKSFGELDLYAVNDSLVQPHIYIPNEITYSTRRPKNITDLTSFPDNRVGGGLFFSNDLSNDQRTRILKNTTKTYIYPTNIDVNETRGAHTLFLNVPRASLYEVHMRFDEAASINFNETSIILNNETRQRWAVTPSFKSVEKRYEPQSVEFVELQWCEKCDTNLTAVLRLKLPSNVLPYDEGKDAVYFDGKRKSTFTWNQTAHFVEVNAPIVSGNEVGISDDWVFVDDIEKADIFTSRLFTMLPNGLDTRMLKKNYLVVVRGKKPLNETFESPLVEVDSVVIGQINRRRVTVTVPSGSKPKGKYKVFYIDEKEIAALSSNITMKYRVTNRWVMLGALDLDIGLHNLTFYLDGSRGPEWFEEESFVLREKRSTVKWAIPDISFRMNNHAEYEVYVANATNPYYLVFSESYLPDWNLFIRNDRAPVEEHFLVNGYANAWYINETGDYVIRIEYGPNGLLRLGMAISIVTLLSCCKYLLRCRKTGEGECIRTDTLSPQTSEGGMASKVFPGLALFLIAGVAVMMILNWEGVARTMAVLAYLSLTIGVLIKFAKYLRIKGDAHEH